MNRLAFSLPIVFALLSAAPARSSTIIYVSPVGSSVLLSPVSVEVDIILDPLNHQITLTLLNFEDNIQRDFQALANVQITLSNLVGAIQPTVQSSTFSAITVANGAVPVLVSSQPASSWQVSTSGSTLLFCANCPSGGNKELVIGAPDATTGHYSGGNSAVYNASHNPYLLGSGGSYTGPLNNMNNHPSWVLNVPQLTSSSTVTGVKFGFGTIFTNPQITGEAIPEPGSGSLVFAGCFLIGLSVFFKRRRSSLVKATSHTED